MEKVQEVLVYEGVIALLVAAVTLLRHLRKNLGFFGTRRGLLAR
ncbi:MULTISPECIES: hypothetical protein [Streptomyces]